MKKLVIFLAAVFALALVAFTPDPASAGKGWRGGHWHGGGWYGRGWRGPRVGYRGWRRGPHWGYAGWGGPRYRGRGWGRGVYVRAPYVNVTVGPRYGRGCWDPYWGRVPCRRWY